MTRIEDGAQNAGIYPLENTTKPKKKNIFQKLKTFIVGKKDQKPEVKVPTREELLKKFEEIDASMLEEVYKFKKDAILVEREKLANVAKASLAQQQMTEKVRKLADKKDYEKAFADYVPTDVPKYEKTKETILHSKNLTDPSRADGICKMVCKLSDDYGVDPEIIVRILEVESSFQFTPRVMKNPGRSYKGVMQVHKDIICSMYADPDDAYNSNLSSYERALAYDHRHFVKDQKRIDELKEVYPTPDDLYKAIQEDVSLGMEVGIMAYKSKLSVCKGNTRAALASYCGNQYKLPKDSTAATRIYPIPEYMS